MDSGDVRVLVTGSRDYWNVGNVTVGLNFAVELFPPVDHSEVVLVHGDARGADSLCAEFAESRGWGVEPHPADWSAGRGAGPVRNQEMVDAGADVLVAFPLDDSVGTWDCYDRAYRAGITCVVVGEDGSVTVYGREDGLW